MLHANVSSYLNTPFSATEVNGVITPLSLAALDGPHIHEIITPLEEPLATEYQAGVWNDFDSYQGQYWQPQEYQKTCDFNYNSFVMDFDNMYHQQNAAKIDTAPTSPSFFSLPIPSNREVSDVPPELATSGGEELVGMGLYDSPADVQASKLNADRASLFNSAGPAQRGLKLEDSFEPSDLEDQDEDDGQPDDEAEDPIDETDEWQVPIRGGPSAETTFTNPDSSTALPNYFVGSHDESSQPLPTSYDGLYSHLTWTEPVYQPYGWI